MKPETISALFADATRGDGPAADQLMELFYPELKRLAVSRMRRERSEHTWQATELVNELYLELLKIKALRPVTVNDEKERAAFLKLASLLMRRLLIHHIRPTSYQADRTDVSLSLPQSGTDADTLAWLEHILARLEAIDPKLRTVVELKVFYGYSTDEIAAHLECSRSTVGRHWNFAKAWLGQILAN